MKRKYGTIVETQQEYKNIWVTADPHYFHTNIIRYCNRPFETVQEMNDALVANHNEVVGDDDLVIYLGDFALMGRDFNHLGPSDKMDLLRDLMSSLNGDKALVLGNHDRMSNKKYVDMGFIDVCERYTFKKERLILTHNPKDMNKGTPNNGKFRWLAGHVHGAWESIPYCFNVGVDTNNFKPILLTEAISSIHK